MLSGVPLRAVTIQFYNRPTNSVEVVIIMHD